MRRPTTYRLRLWYDPSMADVREGNASYYSNVAYKDVRLGDLLLSTLSGDLSQCVFSNGAGGMNCTGILQLARFRGIVTTTSLNSRLVRPAAGPWTAWGTRCAPAR